MVLNQKRFMSLLIPNQRQIHSYILVLVGNRSDADDILQDTLAEMWNEWRNTRKAPILSRGD